MILVVSGLFRVLRNPGLAPPAHQSVPRPPVAGLHWKPWKPCRQSLEFVFRNTPGRLTAWNLRIWGPLVKEYHLNLNHHVQVPFVNLRKLSSFYQRVLHVMKVPSSACFIHCPEAANHPAEQMNGMNGMQQPQQPMCLENTILEIGWVSSFASLGAQVT